MPFPEGKAAAEVLKAGENPGPGREDPGDGRRRIGAMVKLAAESGLRMIPDNAVARGLLRQVPRLHGHQPVAGAARRRLHRRLEHRHRGAVGQHPVVAISRFRSTTRSSWTAIRRSPRRSPAPSAGDTRGRDLVDQDPLSRRRRDADRRHVDAVLAAQVAGVGHPQRLRRRAQGQGRSRRRNRARPADEVDADRAGAVRDAAGAAVPGDRRAVDGQHPDDASS